MTPGEGTRSYAKALFKFRCSELEHPLYGREEGLILPAIRTHLVPYRTLTRICMTIVSPNSFLCSVTYILLRCLILVASLPTPQIAI